jgi:hypothetical protein
MSPCDGVLCAAASAEGFLRMEGDVGSSTPLLEATSQDKAPFSTYSFAKMGHFHSAQSEVPKTSTNLPR